MKVNMISNENLFEKNYTRFECLDKYSQNISSCKKINFLRFLSYLDENISHLPSVIRLLLFRANQDFKIFDKYVLKKKKIEIDSRKLHVFSHLPIFLIIFMETVCAFPRYFTLTVFRFSWLLIDYYKYLPPDFMDCFAITSTLNIVMTKTRNIVFSKAILILTNKKPKGLVITIVTVDYMHALFSYVQ